MQLNIEEIKDRLKLRYPYLMVDRVTSLYEDEITAVKNVTVNEPFFRGHFPDPGRSIMPGTMIVESMAQVAGLLAGYKGGKDSVGYLTGVDGARFRSFVQPGDRLVLNGTHLKHRAGLHRVKMEASVEEELVAEGTILLALEGVEEHGKNN